MGRTKKKQAVDPHVRDKPKPVSLTIKQPRETVYPSVIPQKQSNRIQNARLQGSHLSSTSICYPTLMAENKHHIQLPLTSTAASTAAFAYVPVAENIDWNFLIIQYQHARSTYLPELTESLKRAQQRCFQGQDAKQFETAIMFVWQWMVNFLRMPEGELIKRFSKEEVYHILMEIARCCGNQLSKKSIMFCGSQVPQLSNRPIYLNNGPITPLVHTSNTTLIRNSTISSWPLPSSLNSPYFSDAYANRQVVEETLLHHGPKGTADNAHHNLKNNPRLSHSSSEDQPLKVMQSRKQKKLPQKKADFTKSMSTMSAKLPKRFSAKTVQKKNASFVSDPRATSQTKPKKSTVSLSPSSVSLSFSPKKIAKPARKPMERLIQVVQSMSKEALRSSINDIASVMNLMMVVDNLPVYANAVNSRTANCSQAICCSISDGYTPHINMKRNIDSVVGYVSTLDNCGSCTKKPRNELNHYLMDEIREINQRLIETVIEVDSDSDLISSNAIIIKCTYKPVCSTRHVASIASLSTLSIKLLVPSDYPFSPPEILDRLPVGSCEESIDWKEEVNSRFDRHVRGLKSLGLGEMAQAWHDTARSVFSDFVVSLGGGCFSSKCGTWECVPAT